MDFRWSDYLVLAQALVIQSTDHPNKEAMLRAAISRAYYGVFITCRNYLRDEENISFSAEVEAHYNVAQRFRANGSRKRREIAKSLHRLRIQRNRADYDDVFVNLARNASSTIAEAQRIIGIIDGL